MKSKQTMFALAFCGCVVCITHWPFTNRFVASQEEKPSMKLLEQYAQAQLRLAEVDLRRVEEYNVRTPHTFPAIYVEELRSNLEAAREQVKFVQANGDQDLVQLQLRGLATSARMAQNDLNQAKDVNRTMPGAIRQIDLDQLSAAADVAMLRFKLAEEPGKSRSSIDLMHWHVERLTSEVQALQRRVDELSLHR
ncbi:MAG: hypothetical protein WCH39_22065 [Schlesneria sp.]|jgi:hypothetical protein